MLRYAGSLTTPACSEGVRWHVMQAPTTVSQAQVTAFLEVVEAERPPRTAAEGPRRLQRADVAREAAHMPRPRASGRRQTDEDHFAHRGAHNASQCYNIRPSTWRIPVYGASASETAAAGESVRHRW